MALSTLTSKGQLTVPKEIRDYLKIDSGDKIEFLIDEEGHVIMSPKTLKIDEIVGMIKRKAGVSIEDMNSAITNFMRTQTRGKGTHERD